VLFLLGATLFGAFESRVEGKIAARCMSVGAIDGIAHIC
jgi:hypothetical protein